jgi:hypothetical protein
MKPPVFPAFVAPTAYGTTKADRSADRLDSLLSPVDPG